MLYVSQLQGKQVWDAWGQAVGYCKDILVGDMEQPFPPLRALALRNGGSAPEFVAAEQVSGLYPSIILTVPRAEVKAFSPRGDELWLLDRVLDRQIVDTDGRRVVRVNDLQIARVRDRFCLTGVDVGGLGLLRRLGLERPVCSLLRLARCSPSEGVIPWEDVAPLHREDPIRLRVSRNRISQLPPADIAAILYELDRKTGQALITSLDNETLADAMEEIPADMQVAVLSQLKPERAADVLESMAPDEAADLLADLPSQTSEQLLDLMEDEDSEDVRLLLDYPEDTAGGIMTTEYAAVPIGLTVGETLNHLRRSDEAQDDEAIYYVYVMDDKRHLRGVISLRDLIMAPADVRLDDQIHHHPVTVRPLTPQRQVAYLVAKYNLLSLPVVNEDGVMLGIVTVDDALDAVLPTAWKKRLPRFF